MKQFFIMFGVLLVIGAGAFWYFNRMSTTENGSSTTVPAAVLSFSNNSTNFIVTGRGLSRVEIWAVPAPTSEQGVSTGTAASESVKLGDAMIATPTRQGDAERWVLSVPKDPVVATELYALGFDSKGVSAGKAVFPAVGATAIFNALWKGQATTTQATSTPKAPPASSKGTLTIGQTKTINGISVTLNKITEDSRCPAGVTCVWAGRVSVEVFLKKSGMVTTTTISTSGQSKKFAGLAVAIAGVKPEKTATSITPADYTITFVVGTPESASTNDTGGTTPVTTGISGMVTIGPTCPVEHVPPDPACADKPYKTTLVATDKNGTVVKTISVPDTGEFTVSVPPGRYTLAPSGDASGIPHASSQEVIVIDGKVTAVNVVFDSGIR